MLSWRFLILVKFQISETCIQKIVNSCHLECLQLRVEKVRISNLSGGIFNRGFSCSNYLANLSCCLTCQQFSHLICDKVDIRLMRHTRQSLWCSCIHPQLSRWREGFNSPSRKLFKIFQEVCQIRQENLKTKNLIHGGQPFFCKTNEKIDQNFKCLQVQNLSYEFKLTVEWSPIHSEF